ncbi:hypothetical protein EIN_505180 [Entamoeba invadens IP1]|uniref:Ras-GAP domain-containing protein n=1 Tax=Entamoeba invadens IP1 TaxID=370355 RepID=A0A0A1U7D1_ENTIV|nr:hypothetical protein EIN_505180 [Entamoeba invadens IP1]ELP90312.1 hypothetical protein EIN_505180 [Entamoeba invadens IP1]|eukprot:XP_004257083.1 hypothetical protein EIN_505180 [Entamoeba invadens IP1]
MRKSFATKPEMKAEGASFSIDDFKTVYSKYTTGFADFVEHPEVAVVIGENLMNYEQDQFVELASEFYTTNNKIIPLLKLLISTEVEKCQHKEVVFRQNNLCSKFLMTFSRSVARKFFKDTFSGYIQKVVTTPQCYEIDETRLVPGQILGSNLAQLVLSIKEYADILTKTKTLLPYEIVEVSKIMYNAVLTKFQGDEEFSMKTVTTFLINQIFTRVVSRPEESDIYAVETKLGLKSTRNLEMVSGGVRVICAHEVGNEPKCLDKVLASSKGLDAVFYAFSKYVVLEAPTPTQSNTTFQISRVTFDDLFILHNKIHSTATTVSDGKISCSDESKILIKKLDDTLGKPPSTTPIDGSNDRVMSDFEIVRKLERERILYRGGELSTGEKVYYITISLLVKLLKLAKESNPDDPMTLIDLLTSVLMNMSKAFVFVFDCSWFNGNDLPQNELITMCSSLVQLPQNIKTNFKHGYILHPEKNVKKTIESMISNYGAFSLSNGWNKNFDIVDDWQTLSKLFGETEVVIPEGSKLFVKREFHALKVNPKGKAQNRIILMTFNALLNIEPSSHDIMNEIELKGIKSVELFTGSPHVVIHFEAVTGRERKKKEDKTERTYILLDMAARETLLKLLFSVCFYREVLNGKKLEFDVFNGTKKSNSRIVVCVDRVVVIKKNELEHDIVYVSLKSVTITDGKTDDFKTVSFLFETLKNGGIEWVEKKFGIMKEDVCLVDIVNSLRIGKF